MRQRKGPGGKRGSSRTKSKGTGNYVAAVGGGTTEVTKATQADAQAYQKSMKKRAKKGKSTW